MPAMTRPLTEVRRRGFVHDLRGWAFSGVDVISKIALWCNHAPNKQDAVVAQSLLDFMRLSTE